MDEDLFEIAPVKSFKERTGRSFLVNGEDIAVFLIDGTFYVVSNICPHQHVPLIAEGMLEDCTITCPMHGWKYDLQTGKGVHGAGIIEKYETEIKRGVLYVRIPEKEENEWW